MDTDPRLMASKTQSYLCPLFPSDNAVSDKTPTEPADSKVHEIQRVTSRANVLRADGRP